MLKPLKYISALSIVVLTMVIGCNSSSNGPRNTFTLKSQKPKGNTVDAYEFIEITMNEPIKEGSVYNSQADVLANIAASSEKDNLKQLRVVANKNEKPDFGLLTNEEVTSDVKLGQLMNKEMFLVTTLISGSSELQDSTQAAYFSNYSSKVVAGESDGSSRYFVEVRADKLDATGNLVQEQVLLYQVLASSPQGQQDTLIVKSLVGSQPVAGTYSVDGSRFIFQPSTPLDWNTKYKVTVSGDLESATSDFTLGSDLEWEFMTGDQPDPEISFVSHSGDLASAISPIDVRFNFEPDGDNVWSEIFVVLKVPAGSGRPQPVEGEIKVQGRHLVFTPAKDFFDYSSSYSITINGNISGKIGNESIVFNPGGFSRGFSIPGPMVSSYYPTSDQEHPSPVGVSIINQRQVTVGLQINFIIDKSTVNINNVYLIRLGSSKKVEASYYVNGSDISMVTNSPLEYGADYEVVVSTNVKSTAKYGNVRLPSQHVWDFSTQSRQITAIYPNPNFQGEFMPGESAFIETNFDISRGLVAISDNLDEISSSTLGSQSRSLRLKTSENGLVRYGGAYVFSSNIFYTTNDGFEEEFFSASYPSAFGFGVPAADVNLARRFPTPGSTGVAQNELIEISFEEAIDVFGVSALSALKIDLFEVTNCYNEVIDGSLTLNALRTELSFRPYLPLESFCDHTIEVFPGVPLTDSGKTSAGTIWSFTTGGLKVESIFADYENSGLDIVRAGSRITLEFNESINVIDSSGIYFEELDFAGNVLYVEQAQTSEFFDELRIDLYSPFESDPNFFYGASYRLVIEQGAIEGDSDESSLVGDWTYEFTIEEDPEGFDASGIIPQVGAARSAKDKSAGAAIEIRTISKVIAQSLKNEKPNKQTHASVVLEPKSKNLKRDRSQADSRFE